MAVNITALTAEEIEEHLYSIRRASGGGWAGYEAEQEAYSVIEALPSFRRVVLSDIDNEGYQECDASIDVWLNDSGVIQVLSTPI